MARVRWNEENLQLNDESRTATMTIDEPPTPFNFEYCEDEEDEEDSEPIPEQAEVSSNPSIVPPQPNPPALPAQVSSFAAQWEQAGLDQALSDPSNLRPSCEEMTEEEREAARIAFEKNRKKHYEMGKVLGAPPPKDEDEDEDEEEGSAAEAKPPTGSTLPEQNHGQGSTTRAS